MNGKKLVIGIFIACPLVIVLLMLLHPDAPFSDAENRSLKTRGEIAHSVSALFDTSFQNDLEAWLSDQFPQRAELKSAEVSARYALGQREIGGVYVGKDKRLFAAITDAMTSTDALSDEVRSYETIADETGLPVYVMLVPAAGCVLSDELPVDAPMYDYDTLYDTAAETLAGGGNGKVGSMPDETSDEMSSDIDARATSGVLLLNIRDVLREGEEISQTYYKTDHHFTTYGAYLVYAAFQKAKGETAKLYEDFEPYVATETFRGSLYRKALLPSVAYDEIELLGEVKNNESLTVTADGKEIPFYDETALQENDPYRVFQGGNHGITIIENKNPAAAKSNKTLLLLGDSFTNTFVQFLTDDYQTIVKVDRRYTLDSPETLAKTYHVDEIAIVREMVSGE